VQKWVLDQIASHLKTIGRKIEVKEVRALKKELYGKKKE
jgi:hypothetical protein